MCDAYTPGGEPIPTNKRFNAEKIFSHPDVVAEEPWYLFLSTKEEENSYGYFRLYLDTLDFKSRDLTFSFNKI